MTAAPGQHTTPAGRRRLLTVDQAAETLGMGRTAVFEQIRAGRLKSVKVGRARRIPADYIDDFVNLLKAEADTDNPT